MDEEFQTNLSEAIRYHQAEAKQAAAVARSLAALQRGAAIRGSIPYGQIRKVVRDAQTLTDAEDMARRYFYRLGEVIEELGSVNRR